MAECIKVFFKSSTESVFCIDVQPVSQEEKPLVASGGEDDMCYIWEREGWWEKGMRVWGEKKNERVGNRKSCGASGLIESREERGDEE